MQNANIPGSLAEPGMFGNGPGGDVRDADPAVRSGSTPGRPGRSVPEPARAPTVRRARRWGPASPPVPARHREPGSPAGIGRRHLPEEMHPAVLTRILTNGRRERTTGHHERTEHVAPVSTRADEIVYAVTGLMCQGVEGSQVRILSARPVFMQVRWGAAVRGRRFAGAISHGSLIECSHERPH